MSAEWAIAKRVRVSHIRVERGSEPPEDRGFHKVQTFKPVQVKVYVHL